MSKFILQQAKITASIHANISIESTLFLLLYKLNITTAEVHLSLIGRIASPPSPSVRSALSAAQAASLARVRSLKSSLVTDYAASSGTR